MDKTIALSDGRILPVVAGGSPIHTNASLNRAAAMKVWKAGGTSQDIAKEWPEVFKLTFDGKLSQQYDYALADGSGRLETNRLITGESVKKLLRRLKQRAYRQTLFDINGHHGKA